ncbi:heme-binding protein 2 [Oryzias melastigma]|uniref:Heme-binding protein 1 n=1 Tax=Oryzias melastigma TaxID=30732 RepID=A0A3B3CXB1_ORYME|nr:heme-binding protein 2 [Oryzias melastigma]
MIFLAGLVGFVLALTAEARVGDSSNSKLCTETKECLLFDLVCETSTYQVRRYDSVKWVSTNESSYFFEIAAPKMFSKLFKYITGENEEGQKIEMTSPVVVRIPEKRIWEKGEYTMSFLLPSEHQSNPPKPTNEDVYIKETPEMNVYLKSYGGWITTMSDNIKSNALSSALDAANAAYKKGSHYAVGYNSPMTILKRNNEVWYMVEGDPVCDTSE